MKPFAEMTADEILALPAGRPLDALVAQFLGAPEIVWETDSEGHRVPLIRYCPADDAFATVPWYSKEATHAPAVADALAARGVLLSLHCRGEGRWLAELWTPELHRLCADVKLGGRLPHVVCLAALLAVTLLPKAG